MPSVLEAEILDWQFDKYYDDLSFRATIRIGGRNVDVLSMVMDDSLAAEISEEMDRRLVNVLTKADLAEGD